MGNFSRDVEPSYDREDKEWQIKLQMIDAICKLNPNENMAKLERESFETIRGKLGYLTRMKTNNSELEEDQEVFDDFAFEERDSNEYFDETNGFGR